MTGAHGGRDGDEDLACAEYVHALLRGEQPDVTPYLDRVRASDSGRRFADVTQPDFPPADLALAVEVDRFKFAMVVARRDGALVLERAAG